MRKGVEVRIMPARYAHETPEWLTAGYRWNNGAVAEALAAIHFRRSALSTFIIPSSTRRVDEGVK